MPLYAWKNTETGEVVEVQRTMSEATIAPDDSGKWERIFTFGIGRVEGGGGSPGRPS